MNNQLFTKAKKLPPEVFAYLDSYKSDDLNLLIIDKYKLVNERLLAYYDLIPQLFLKEVPVNNLVEEIKKLFGFSDNVARQMACDIAGVRLLVVADWLQADIAGLIKAWGGEPKRYTKYTEDQIEAIPKEAEWNAEQWAEPVDYAEEFADDDEADWPAREKTVKEIFSRNLVEILGLDDDYLLKEINNTIFYLIANENDNLNEELSGLMLNSTEKLTSQAIMLDGRPSAPTIGNWLAYFFSQKGTEMFDAVTLSDFMINAPAAQTLNQEEKFLLTNLLIVYRSLKFFPESLASANPADWFIFPLQEEDQTTDAEPVQPKPVMPAQITPPRFRRLNEQFQTEVVGEELPKIGHEDPRIKELEAQAAQYIEGSIERAALEEEIEKLKRG